MRDYQEVPYRIYRRQASDAETRDRLGWLRGEAASKISFYLAILEMESPLAWLAYRDLRNQTRRRGALFSDWAWQQSPIDNDSSMALNPPFRHDNNDEERLCVACMRYDLKVLNWRRRRPLVAQMEILRSRRESDAPPSFDEVERGV
jgi:hypothetical protein